MSPLDIVLFVVSVTAVIGFGIWKGEKGRRADTQGDAASDYFLAGRGLTWWLVGFSLIAANISTEQFVGMSGNAADWLGMAIASYEWMAAITLVIVGFAFLPKFLRCGLYTIPQFLEYRYGVVARTAMAVVTLVILVGVPTASVVFSGAKVISVFFQEYSVIGLSLGDITTGCWIIGICAAVYVFVGGLRACAWTDLIWGSALIVGGAVVAYLAFQALGSADAGTLIQTKVATSGATIDQIANSGALERFRLLNAGEAVTGPNGIGGKLHMIRPADDTLIPWTALIVGLWIPNFFYWGLNQYIMQRTLGSKSLAEGQKGIVFAAALKLIIPFVVVIPGILAFNLYNADLRAEGMRKNSAIIASFEQGGEGIAYPFSDNYASLNPDLALTMVAHNAKLAGVPAPVGEMDALALAQANMALVDAAVAKGAGRAIKLVGYDYDSAFPVLLRNLLKPGMTWFVLAAIFGAVVSSLASMLNSASTIFSMDIWDKLVRKGNSGRTELVLVGRICVVVFIAIACLIAPNIGKPVFVNVFTFIQEFQGFISPGALAVFIVGFYSHRAPRFVGWLGIVSNAVIYGLLKVFVEYLPPLAQSFLNRMAISFFAVLIIILIVTKLKPAQEPVVLPENGVIELESSMTARIAAIGVVIATLALYAIFW